jgi:hypothetical protein
LRFGFSLVHDVVLRKPLPVFRIMRWRVRLGRLGPTEGSIPIKISDEADETAALDVRRHGDGIEAPLKTTRAAGALALRRRFPF